MKKVAINICHGGFNLSPEALGLYAELAGIADAHTVYAWDIPRDDAILIGIIQDLADTADGEFSKLKIVEIPDDVEWEIGEYDGVEWIAEVHRKWQ